MIPDEVSRRLKNHYRLGTLDPSRVAVFDKRRYSRGGAWAKTIGRVGQVKTPRGPRNPWRKNHTDNYWCWYLEGAIAGAPVQVGDVVEVTMARALDRFKWHLSIVDVPLKGVTDTELLGYYRDQAPESAVLIGQRGVAQDRDRYGRWCVRLSARIVALDEGDLRPLSLVERIGELDGPPNT